MNIEGKLETSLHAAVAAEQERQHWFRGSILQNAGANRLSLIGIAAMAVPTLVSLAQEAWGTEAGAHGPIVLATAVWLFWRSWPDLVREAQPGVGMLPTAIFAVMLPAYVFGRAYDFLFIEVGALFVALSALLLMHFGWKAMRTHWFLFVYAAFLIQPPGWAMDAVTQPLKAFVSVASTELMQTAGIPVYREGVTLYVAQYQLLVEDACAGMNSLIGLVSISLFYIYVLRRAGWRYSLLLACLIVPVAVLANMVRIMLLVLLTWTAGDAVAQGFLHNSAGLLVFVVALALIIGIDALLARAIRPKVAPWG